MVFKVLSNPTILGILWNPFWVTFQKDFNPWHSPVEFFSKLAETETWESHVGKFWCATKIACHPQYGNKANMKKKRKYGINFHQSCKAPKMFHTGSFITLPSVPIFKLETGRVDYGREENDFRMLGSAAWIDCNCAQWPFSRINPYPLVSVKTV